MERRHLLGVGAAGLAGLAGCAGVLGVGPTGRSDGTYDVGMSAEDFLPASIEVNLGDTVVWKNTSSHAHTVTAVESGLPEDAEYFASGGYDSQQAASDAYFDEPFGGSISAGDTYEHTFRTVGTFPYYCIPHKAAGMAGQVVVTEP
ncbi:MAG: plastocyanin/azurin family copper-binding protein [Halobacteriaceae archaeon]